MHARTKLIGEQRAIDLTDGCTYTGLGRNSFRKWAEEIGAVIRVGGSVRYDKRVIDNALDEIVERGQTA